jgi:hypothetical protein
VKGLPATRTTKRREGDGMRQEAQQQLVRWFEEKVVLNTGLPAE